MTFHVVTVATHAQSYFPVLRESCKRSGVELEVLGWGTKWTGFAYKFSLMRDYIADMPPDDIVLFCDGYDVLMLEHRDEVLRRYATFKKPVVISCERGTSKLSDYTATRVFGPKCEGSRINSGCYIGTVKCLSKMFDVMCAQFDCSIGHQDDQQMLTAICHDTDFFVQYVEIDRNQLLFLTATRPHNPYDTTIPTDSEVFRVDEALGKVIVNYTNMPPCFMHANGGGNMVPFVRLYGLPQIQLESTKAKTLSVVKHYSVYFWKECLMITIVFCLLLFLSYLTYKDRLARLEKSHILDRDGLCQGAQCRAYRDRLEARVRSLSPALSETG